jgi:adenylate kinase
LDVFLISQETSITHMLSLEVEESELRNRLAKRAETSGRPDDANPEVIQKRIDVYNAETAPVADYYKVQGKFEGVDGLGSIDVITKRLFNAID